MEKSEQERMIRAIGEDKLNKAIQYYWNNDDIEYSDLNSSDWDHLAKSINAESAVENFWNNKYRPTKQEVKELYQEIRTVRKLDRKSTLELMGESAGVSHRTVDGWISSDKKSCPPACWRCLMIDFRNGRV